MPDLNINLLRDTEDPEREKGEKETYHPPKLRDLKPQAPRGPKPTAKAPQRTLMGFLKDFFGIKPKPPGKPRIITSRPETTSGKGSDPTPVPFQAAPPVGYEPKRTPMPEEFTVRPRASVPEAESPKGNEGAIRGEPLLEDLLAEPPPMIGTPGALRKPPPPPPHAKPITPFTPKPVPPRPERTESLLEDILAEPLPQGTPAVRPLPPPLPPPSPGPPPPSEPVRGTTFSELSIAGVTAAPVKRGAIPIGAKPVPRSSQRVGSRVRAILGRILPKRTDKLPEGETPDQLDVNLIPEELSAKLNVGDKLITLGLATLGVAVLIGIGFTVLNLIQTNIIVEKRGISDQIQNLRSETLAFQAEQRKAIALRQRADAVQYTLARHVRWTRFFKSLEAVTEPDVYFVNFQGDLSGNLTLSAFGKSYDSVARQYTTLQNAKDFVQRVAIDGAQYNAEEKAVTFTTSLTLVPNFYLEPPT